MLAQSCLAIAVKRVSFAIVASMLWFASLHCVEAGSPVFQLNLIKDSNVFNRMSKSCINVAHHIFTFAVKYYLCEVLLVVLYTHHTSPTF